jgi:hypothetical protein
MRDEILEEVWRARDEFAKKHNYDIRAMVATLQEKERKSGRKIVDLSGGGRKRESDAPMTEEKTPQAE